MFRLLKLSFLEMHRIICKRIPFRLLFMVTGGLFVSLNFAIVVSASGIAISHNSTANTLTASASGADGSTWKNNYANATIGNSTCDSTTTFGTASSTANVVNITWEDNGKWVCFTVTKSGSSIYGKHQIDLGPIITVAQENGSGEVLTASSSSTDLPTNPVWQHSGPFSTTQDCTSSTLTWFNGNKIKYIDYKQYYCFKVADTGGNTSYARFKTKPGYIRLDWKLSDIQPAQQKKQVEVRAVDVIPGLKSCDQFGNNIAIDGDRLVVGSPNYDIGMDDSCSDDDEDENNNDPDEDEDDIGSIYIYKKNSWGYWNLEEHIVDERSSNPRDILMFNHLKAGDLFGQAVAINGDRIAVGAPW